jgi:hypothetical protein
VCCKLRRHRGRAVFVTRTVKAGSATARVVARVAGRTGAPAAGRRGKVLSNIRVRTR